MSSKSVDFSTVQKVAEKGISEYCIVDVRRGDEVKTTGLIPSSHHIPRKYSLYIQLKLMS